MTAPNLQVLRRFLYSCSPGKIADVAALQRLLKPVWDCLDGSDEDAMAEHKLHRLEDPHWDPPILSFTVERHGGTVKASVYAELQMWTVDVEKAEASCQVNGKRQVDPKQPPLKAEPIVSELAQLVRAQKSDQRLTWTGPHWFRLNIGVIIPDAVPAQTTRGRRKRLRAKLEEALSEDGWRKIRPNYFERS